MKRIGNYAREKIKRKGIIMGKLRGCANCGKEAMTGSTLCADCLVAGLVETELQRDEIFKLKTQLRLQRRLLKHVFGAYQELLAAAKETVCIKRDMGK